MFAANTSYPVLTRSRARTSPYASSVSNGMSSASGLLNRNISTVTGVSVVPSASRIADGMPGEADPGHGGAAAVGRPCVTSPPTSLTTGAT
jgi:hypothetical protein